MAIGKINKRSNLTNFLQLCFAIKRKNLTACSIQKFCERDQTTSSNRFYLHRITWDNFLSF
ncbi:hypothetical protein AP460_00240 [Actinobacillus pleuropneumoniae]|nr:hypothetical protein appser4_1540 [Actinobacillus pleuropneumoniae serovar 4 str. M62]KIE93145.1 hypothetical protein AP518_00098 [Actinobacillus pleuropneumoniae]KIE93549.1 hypothetical protein AP460_00240 [Actinobacillus pleuropneumoniae]KIE93746.1 hypothetical protein AP1022_00095 [Actinobacillus pleuropneumoniae]KIE98576.1 hypothetical protein AP5651_00098 [Actinobacillus pleuropneumoniae]